MTELLPTLARYSGYAAVAAAIVTVLQYAQVGDIPLTAGVATLVLIVLTFTLRAMANRPELPGQADDDADSKTED